MGPSLFLSARLCTLSLFLGEFTELQALAVPCFEECYFGAVCNEDKASRFLHFI